MKPTDDLFRLVKSMPGAEKRYFKLSSSIYERGKNYMLLFNAIEKQENVYDEAQVMEELKGEKWLSQLPKTKHQLYDCLLNSLEYYNRNSDVDSELKSYLHRVKILHAKGLHKQCEKILLKAKLLAEKHEKYESLLELLKWERTIIISNPGLHDVKQRLDALYNERKVVVAKMENTSAYQELADKMYTISMTEYVVRSDDKMQEMKNIIKHPLLLHESNAITQESKRLFYHIHALFCKNTGNGVKSYYYQQKIVELIESTPDGMKEHPGIYLNSIHNLCNTAGQFALHDEFFLALKKLRAIPEMLGSACTEYMKVKVFERSYNHELSMYIDTCQFKKALPLIGDTEKWITEFKGKIEKLSEIIFYINCAYVYFITQDYHKALVWNNKIINDAADDIRHDIYCDARLLNLLIHYELGNEDLLENVVKSTHRYLYKKNRLYKTETAILNFIRKKVPKIFTDKERLAAFKELKTELEEITKDAFEKNVLKDIDYVSWLESKISNKPFAQVLRGKTPHKQ